MAAVNPNQPLQTLLQEIKDQPKNQEDVMLSFLSIADLRLLTQLDPDLTVRVIHRE
jgi:hypothetical protein